MSLRVKMDAIYRDMPLSDIPWCLEEPPQLLVQFMEHQQAACKVVDLGCGAGQFAIWLAARGFSVTGIDLSPQAVRVARRLSKEKGVACQFIATDLRGDVPFMQSSFDLGYDWEVLHHVAPRDRPDYIRTVRGLLRPGGRYLSVSFSEEDEFFGGRGTVRRTPLGTTLYFSSPEELRRLFESIFEVERLSVERIPAKVGSHLAVCAILRKTL